MVYLKKIVMMTGMMLTLISAQSPYNSAGMGLLSDFSAAPAFGLGMSGLMGGYNHSVSAQNPSTWPELKFSKLTVHYVGGEIQNHNFKTSFGSLGDASFILPIKGEYALGFGLQPFANKTFRLLDSTVQDTIFAGDTLALSTDLSGSGGIGTLRTGIAKKFSDRLAIGVNAEFLFGVSSESAIIIGLFSGDTTVVITRNHEIKGTFLSLYLTSSLFDTPAKSSLHFSIRAPVGTRKLIERENHAFIDNDGDLEHTPWDDPLPYDVSSAENNITSFSLPVDLSVGVMYNLSGSTYLVAEFVNRRFDKEDQFPTSSISSTIDPGHRLALGLLKEGKTESRSLLKRLHYRIGFFDRQHYISNNGQPVTEQGLALGIGIPFGVTRNQIDIGFQYVERSGFLSFDSEIVNQITIGLTLGDVWLASRKRR